MIQSAELRRIIRKLINEEIEDQKNLHTTVNKLFVKMEKFPEWDRVSTMSDRYKAQAVEMFMDKLGVKSSGYVQSIIKKAKDVSKSGK